jgi:two-component system response regulator RegX3
MQNGEAPNPALDPSPGEPAAAQSDAERRRFPWPRPLSVGAMVESNGAFQHLRVSTTDLHNAEDAITDLRKHQPGHVVNRGPVRSRPRSVTAVRRARSPMRLLIVEDDPSLAASLTEGLERHGFTVDHTASGVDAAGRGGSYDLVLLDLGLPDLDGQEVCRALRASSPVPIIVLTARGDEIDRVLLLELGADDYLVKPFGFRELVARIGAVTRRSLPTIAAGPQIVQELGALRIDRDAHRVHSDGVEIELTPKEYELLAMLAERPGAVRTREDIIDQVWDPHWFGPTKTLDVHVAALRRKLGHGEWISTIRGVGYRLEVPQ